MNNNSIKIIATKRTCKGWKEEEYDIELDFVGLNNTGFYNKYDDTIRFITKPYGNNRESFIDCYINKEKCHFIVSDKEHYSKKELLHKIDLFNNIKSANVVVSFDENKWTSSKAWSIDISKQITVKVLRPSGMQFMGSTIVKEEVFTIIKNTPPDYPVDYGFVEYPENKVCETVAQLVYVLFQEIDILGAEVKIDGKILSYNDANQIRPRNIKLIEIFL